jgi:THO complex subunit 1
MFYNYRAKRRRIGDDLQASGGKVIKMGHPELTRLWNLNPNNMNACKSDDR